MLARETAGLQTLVVKLFASTIISLLTLTLLIMPTAYIYKRKMCPHYIKIII